MNAYIASFMLLLFNAVGLAVPASAAAEERMMPNLGSAASVADAALAGQCSATEAASLGSSTAHNCVTAEARAVQPPVAATSNSRKQVWAVLAMPAEAGDKLEHEEGAP